MRQVLIALVLFLVSLTRPSQVIPQPPYQPDFGEVSLIEQTQSTRLAPPSGTFSRHEILALLVQAEAAHSLPEGLLVAVAKVESNLNPDVVGAQGEVGLMQLHPKYHDISGGVPGQINTAAAYLSEMIARFGLELGISAYNQGPSNPKVSRYVRLVKEAWKK